MRLIRSWYPLLEGTGLSAHDMGPGNAPGTLSADVTWCPYYYPPGIPYGYKGVVIGASNSRILSAAAAGFNSAQGSIEMLVKPSWNNADGLRHTFWFIYGGNNKKFHLYKKADSTTELFTNDTSRGTFTYAFVAGTLYHIVLNWPANELYINKVLVKTFTAGNLGLGAANLLIGDYYAWAGSSFSGNIYYFIVRNVPLTQAEINDFYTFFVNQYT
jgi:hypothetical protein